MRERRGRRRRRSGAGQGSPEPQSDFRDITSEKNITTSLKCKVKEHLLYHLKGAQGLEHVADDEEDVGNAEAGEEPVEGRRHRPSDHHNDDEVHHHGILHQYLAKLGTGRSSIWQEIIS